MGREFADHIKDLMIVDPVLTELARGPVSHGLISDIIAPWVRIPELSAKIPVFGNQAFKLYDTKRAPKAKSNRASLEGYGTLDIRLDEHDFASVVDHQEIKAAKKIQDLREAAARISKSVVDIKREKTWADILQSPGTYPTGHKVTLTSTDQWTDHANSKPLVDIREGKEAIRKKIGRLPNFMAMGYEAYSNLQIHAKLLAMIQYTGNQADRLLSLDLMKAIFEIENIVVGMSSFSNDAGEWGDIWGDNVILAWINPAKSPTEYDQTFAYTFGLEGYSLVDTFFEEGGKIENVRYTDFYKPVVVGAEAAYLIADTNAAEG